MSTRYFKPAQLKQAQVVTVTLTGYDATTTYKITIGNITVSVLGVGGTVATTAAALLTALTNSQAGEFLEVTWSVNSATITGTAVTAGTPFTATSSVSGGAGTIGSVTTTTVNKSPSDFGDSVNWDTFPVSGDSLVIENCNIPILWNLDALSAIDIADAKIRGTFTEAAALPKHNADGDYEEYRPTEMTFGTCTALYQVEANGLQPGSRKFNVGANACTAQFFGAGNGAIGSEVTWFRGTNAANVVRINGASVAIAPISSMTAVIATLAMIAGAVARCGPGAGTLATVTLDASTLDVQTPITTLTAQGGSNILCRQAMTIGTANLYGSTLIYNSSGTITTLTLGSQVSAGAIDFSGDTRAVTITNLVNAYVGSNFNDPGSRVTLSAGIKVPKGKLSQIAFDNGIDRTYTVS